jgi:hypothetical protein
LPGAADACTILDVIRRQHLTLEAASGVAGCGSRASHWGFCAFLWRRFNLMPTMALPLSCIDSENPLSAGRNQPFIGVLPFEAVPEVDSEFESDAEAKADAEAEAEAKVEEDEAEGAEEEEIEEQGRVKAAEEEEEQEHEARPAMSLGCRHGDGRSSPTATASIAVVTTDAPLATHFQPSAEATSGALVTRASLFAANRLELDVRTWIGSDFSNEPSGALAYLKHRMYVLKNMIPIKDKRKLCETAQMYWEYRNQIVAPSERELFLLSQLNGGPCYDAPASPRRVSGVV